MNPDLAYFVTGKKPHLRGPRGERVPFRVTPELRAFYTTAIKSLTYLLEQDERMRSMRSLSGTSVGCAEKD